MGKGARNRRIAKAASVLAAAHGGSWRMYARAIQKGRMPHPKGANQL